MQIGRLDERYRFSVRRFWSGAGVLGSIPGVAVATGVFAVLVVCRLVSLKSLLKVTSEAESSKDRKEMPMRMLRAVLGVSAETAWALGASVTAGLLLSS